MALVDATSGRPYGMGVGLMIQSSGTSSTTTLPWHGQPEVLLLIR